MFDELKISLTVANDAGFLFKKLMRDNDVVTLERNKTPEQLLDGFEKALKAPKDISDLLSAYAYLGAISLSNSPTAIAALDDLDVSGLQWGEELIARIKQRYAPSQRIYMGEVTSNKSSMSSSNSTQRIVIPSV